MTQIVMWLNTVDFLEPNSYKQYYTTVSSTEQKHSKNITENPSLLYIKKAIN